MAPRRALAAAVFALVATTSLGVVDAVQASVPARLWGSPCDSAARCKPQPMYKPRAFQLGSHYWFTSVQWTAWNPFAAAATVTLHAEFGGMTRPKVDRTTVIFSGVKTLCGVKTYTRWVSGDGNAQDYAHIPHTNKCLWYLGAP